MQLLRKFPDVFSIILLLFVTGCVGTGGPQTGYDAGGEWNLYFYENQYLSGEEKGLDEEGIELYTIKTGITRPFQVSKVDSLFDQILSTDEDKNIVFYIHGWRYNFYSLFESSAIPSIESYSDTLFVIIRWPAWDLYLGRPYEKAMNSSEGLAKFFNAFNKYKSLNSSKIGKRKFTMLVHSIGNITLQGFLERYYVNQSLQPGLLNNLIVSSADVPLKNHKSWIGKVDFVNHIFIMQHRRDLILYISEWFLDHPESRGPRLGLGFDGIDGKDKSEIAQNVKYLDLTDLIIPSHHHFHISPTEIDNKIARLYKLLLNGNSIEFPSPSIGLTERHDSLPVFYFHKDDLSYPALSDKEK